MFSSGTELIRINSTRTRQQQPLLLRNSRGYFHAKSTVRKQLTSILQSLVPGLTQCLKSENFGKLRFEVVENWLVLGAGHFATWIDKVNISRDFGDY